MDSCDHPVEQRMYFTGILDADDDGPARCEWIVQCGECQTVLAQGWDPV